jgi:hypothetical protein
MLLKVQEKLKDKTCSKRQLKLLWTIKLQSLQALVYLLTNGPYEGHMQSVQQQLNHFMAAYTAKGKHALPAYFGQRREPKQDTWVVSLRDFVNHQDHNTKSDAKRWHFSIKLCVRSIGISTSKREFAHRPPHTRAPRKRWQHGPAQRYEAFLMRLG